MKKDIHPNYQSIQATCACGNVMQLCSTLTNDIHLDVCGSCHPFYTGQQKVIASGGRVDRFNQRFGALKSK